MCAVNPASRIPAWYVDCSLLLRLLIAVGPVICVWTQFQPMCQDLFSRHWETVEYGNPANERKVKAIYIQAESKLKDALSRFSQFNNLPRVIFDSKSTQPYYEQKVRDLCALTRTEVLKCSSGLETIRRTRMPFRF